MAGFATISSTCSLNSSANSALFVAVVNGFLLASAGCLRVNFVESIASQFLPFFDSDRKQLLVVVFTTISTSSLDSSANLSLSPVAVINGFLLAPEVCLCEFAGVDGLPVFPFRWQTEAARRPKYQNDRNDFISKSSNGDSIRDVAWLKSYKPRSWFILWQTTVFDQSARGIFWASWWNCGLCPPCPAGILGETGDWCI